MFKEDTDDGFPTLQELALQTKSWEKSAYFDLDEHVRLEKDPERKRLLVDLNEKRAELHEKLVEKAWDGTEAMTDEELSYFMDQMYKVISSAQNVQRQAHINARRQHAFCRQNLNKNKALEFKDASVERAIKHNKMLENMLNRFCSKDVKDRSSTLDELA